LLSKAFIFSLSFSWLVSLTGGHFGISSAFLASVSFWFGRGLGLREREREELELERRLKGRRFLRVVDDVDDREESELRRRLAAAWSKLCQFQADQVNEI
jgi:hypothetical protein